MKKSKSAFFAVLLAIALAGCEKPIQRKYRTFETVNFDKRLSKKRYYVEDKNFDMINVECTKATPYIDSSHVEDLLELGAKIVSTYEYTEPVVAYIETSGRVSTAKSLEIHGSCSGIEYIFEGNKSIFSKVQGEVLPWEPPTYDWE